MKKNAKGFTLVELVVVIGISAVILVMASIGINTLFTNKSKAASKTIYNMLGAAQNLGVSKADCYFALKGDSNGNTTVSILKKNLDGTYTVVEEEQIVKVSITVIGSAKSGTIDASFGVMIPIDRNTGGFKSATNCATSWGATEDCGSISEIKVSNDGKDYSIGLVSKTGKYYFK